MDSTSSSGRAVVISPEDLQSFRDSRESVEKTIQEEARKRSEELARSQELITQAVDLLVKGETVRFQHSWVYSDSPFSIRLLPTVVKQVKDLGHIVSEKNLVQHENDPYYPEWAGSFSETLVKITKFAPKPEQKSKEKGSSSPMEVDRP